MWAPVGLVEGAIVVDGGGELAPLIGSIDWAATPIGPLIGWPQSLRTALSI
jgi:hypothetical protein